MNGTNYNQYAPPIAAVADIVPESVGHSPLNLFSSDGRIGRLRYLAYTTGASILQGVLMGLLTAVLGSTLSFVFIAALYVAGIWFTVVCGIKRCHDLDISGWWCLTLFIPLIVLAFIFVPGSAGSNRYGPPPPPNTPGVKILGLMVPVLGFLLGLVAVALAGFARH